MNKTIKVAKNSTLNHFFIPKKGWEGNKKIIFNLEEENAKLNFTAIIIGKKDEKFQFATISIHSGPNTKANFRVKTVLFDNSEIDYKGNLTIGKNADSTESHLSHHSLLLSKNAKIKSLPSLKICNKNVKTSHKATIGKIDKNMLFYLQSRGIDKTTAKELLIKGFLMNEISKIPDEKTKKSFTKTINNLLTKSLKNA